MKVQGHTIHCQPLGKVELYKFLYMKYIHLHCTKYFDYNKAVKKIFCEPFDDILRDVKPMFTCYCRCNVILCLNNFTFKFT